MLANTYRDLKIDGLKCLMIFLVVLGHLTYNDWGIGVNRLIYSFHMPVFVFLSGYLTSRNTNEEKRHRWFKRTLLIYLIAQFAHILLTIGFEYGKMFLEKEAFDPAVISWRVIISPYLALWYLLCLIYWRFSVWYLFPKTNDITLIIISMGLAFLSGFIPVDHDFSFQRAFSLYPYFVMGLAFRKRGLIDKLIKLPYVYALIGLIVGLFISRLLPTYMPKFHYSNWNDLVLRITQTGLGAFLCLCVIRITYLDATEKLAKYGAYTLWIFIGHTYLIRIGEKAFPYLGISLNLIEALLLASLYCYLFYIVANLYQTHRRSKIESV